MTHVGPIWPAVIKHEGEDELMYLSGDVDWQQAAEHTLFSTGGDVLIDSQGRLFHCQTDADVPVLHLTDRVMGLGDFTQILKQHMVALNQCCVSKLYIDTIAQGLQMVMDTVDD